MIDLHTHTTASDGKDTPTELLQKAQTAGLEILSVTDHNSVGAYREIREHRHLFKGKIVTGVELSCSFCRELIEVLGYGIDTDEMERQLKGKIHSFAQKQYKEARIILDTYQKKGVKLGEDFCQKMREDPTLLFDPQRETSRFVYVDEIKKYPENARFVGGEGQLAELNVNTFTRRYAYNPSSELYVDLTGLFLSLNEAVDIIHRCGGVALLAHCFLYSSRVTDHLEQFIRSSGADGIECSYPNFTAENETFLQTFCDQNGLLKSGGSDHHGTLRPNPLGQGTGGRVLEKEEFALLLNKIKSCL